MRLRVGDQVRPRRGALREGQLGEVVDVQGTAGGQELPTVRVRFAGGVVYLYWPDLLTVARSTRAAGVRKGQGNG